MILSSANRRVPVRFAESEHEGLSDKGLGLPLKIASVVKRFGDRDVLEQVDLEIPAGQFVAIVGRSGGGKTTLLRLIAGLERPSAGWIAIGDRLVGGLQPSMRMLFQDARLLMWQTVIGNVGIARSPANWREAALAALHDVGLADRAGEWPALLSGGQKQRVALARALVSRPGVLLLDEPFSALDALTRSEMHELLIRIWSEHRFTVAMITHDVNEAVHLADRVVTLREGRVALDLPVNVARPRRGIADQRTAELQNLVLSSV